MGKLIQFITDERLMIPGTGAIAVRGQVLDCGAGELGEHFRILSEEQQRQMYGHVNYRIIGETDGGGDLVESEDVSDKVLAAEKARTEPTGDHEDISVKATMRPRRVAVADPDEDEEEEVKPKKKSAKASVKSSPKKSSSKSSSKEKVKNKRTRE